MFRALRFMVVLAAIGIATAWLVDNPGDVVLNWQGYRLDTSVGVLLVAIGAFAIASALLYRLWVGLRRAPKAFVRARKEKKRQKGYRALTKGMVAVAAGDAEDAKRYVKDADALLGDPALTLLLSAQAAQLNGDEKAAETFFEAMLARPETEFLGLRGLFSQAIKRNDREQGLKLAQRAYYIRPKSEWVLTSLFDLQIRAGLWTEAETTLKGVTKNKLITSAQGSRRRAVIHYGQSLSAAERGDQAQALKEAEKAHKEDHAFVAATMRLANLLASQGKTRKASKVVEEAWQAAPHPDLLDAYWAACKAEDALAKTRAAQHLAKLNPDHLESRKVLAATALEARLWGEARKHLKALTKDNPGPGVCRMMAELEELEHGDLVKAREWLVRAAMGDADPTWVCGQCGNTISEWSILCGNCEAFDSFSWQTMPHVVPLAPGEVQAQAALSQMS
jgi:HemY protein